VCCLWEEGGKGRSANGILTRRKNNKGRWGKRTMKKGGEKEKDGDQTYFGQKREGRYFDNRKKRKGGSCLRE